MDSVCVAASRREEDDRRQFEWHYAESGPRVYLLAYRMLGSRAEAEDVAQDAFLRAWRHYARYDRERPFDTWLSTIVVNLCIDRRRRAGRVRVCSLDAPIAVDASGSGVLFDPPDPGGDPARQVADGEIEETIRSALADLSADYRAAVLLSAVGEMSYAEIAGVLGCPVGTVRSRIHRGRVQLRRALAPRGPVS